MPTLLAVDDDRLILDCFRFVFPQADVTLHTASTVREAREKYAALKPDAVLLDVQLPDGSGLDLFRQLRDIDSRTPIIFMTGQGTSETAIEAMRLGAYDYIVKPFDPDTIAALLYRAFDISRLMRVPALLESTGQEEGGELLLGRCPAMQDVYKGIGRVSPQDVGVLILGESGTGKEMVARAIYHYSKRSHGPFLAINCAAIPEQLLESELFGHEKGAFTGAERRRIGKFEQCSGGTLFLDEIGDMTPLTQTKILRVLQDQRFERVGGNETIRTDVRVVAATNRDLEQLMKAGQFRGDLFYRLNVYTLRLPPLRERGEDVPLLVESFLKRFRQELDKDVQTVAPAAMDLLRRYSWPGNVRELQSVIKQAMLQASGPVLLPEFLPDAVRGDAGAVPANPEAALDVRALVQRGVQSGSSNLYEEVLHPVEKFVLMEVLRYTGNNQSHAARILGITRQTLRNRLAALGLA